MTTQEIINKVIDNVNIVEVISSYLPVLPDGSGFKAVCPFHNDTNPSMKISTTKKIYKCFSCGAGGNVIQFVQNYEKIPFSKALEKLAKKIGIDYNFNNDPNYEAKQKLYNCLNEANSFYRFYLENSNEAKAAMAYLTKRGISLDIINRFNIGLAPNEKDYLSKALNTNNIPYIDQVESGLVRKVDNDYIDTFKKRIMFPLKDLNNHIVGFSGRIYTKDDHSPKYLNSNENLIFHKSEVLYNYTDALDAIRENNGDVYVFEGFMDVIAASKANIHNAVATMGTALTKQHVKALQMVAKRIILCFDGDNAGIEATYKASAVLSSFNIIPYAVSIKEGLDPDEFQMKYGSDALHQYLKENIVNVYEYMYSLAKADLIINDIVSIQRFKEKVFAFLAPTNPTIKEFYLTKLSNDLNIDLNTLSLDFNYSINKKPHQDEKTTKSVVSPKVSKIKPKTLRAFKIILKYIFMDKSYLNIFVDECLDRLRATNDLSDYIEIFNILIQLKASNMAFVFEDIQDYFNPEQLKILEQALNSQINEMNQVNEFNQCLKTIKDHINFEKVAISKNQALEDSDYIDNFIKTKKNTIKTKEG